MTALPKYKMTVDDFLAWAATQEGRWELFDGVPMAMSPERAIHGRIKLLVAKALERAIEAAGLPCQVLLDCVAVRIDRHRSYQPDVLVCCGDAVPDDALEVANPVVVVEVLSPSNAMKDLRDKLMGYFQVPGVEHYLIVDPDNRLVIHHARGGGDAFATRIVNEGSSLKLDPPGIEVAVAEFFPLPARAS
ncbi:MAG TPA: Uma2 family endonuclease [Hyphomicrobiaceae bacterium]|jgi:Uma2 family endonuclease